MNRDEEIQKLAALVMMVAAGCINELGTSAFGCVARQAREISNSAGKRLKRTRTNEIPMKPRRPAAKRSRRP